MAKYVTLKEADHYKKQMECNDLVFRHENNHDQLMKVAKPHVKEVLEKMAEDDEKAIKKMKERERMMQNASIDTKHSAN